MIPAIDSLRIAHHAIWLADSTRIADNAVMPVESNVVLKAVLIGSMLAMLLFVAIASVRDIKRVDKINQKKRIQL